MTLVEVHRATFVEWTPAAVAALAVTADGRVLAVGREDGAVELYDTADWRCVLRAPGCEGALLTSLLWVESDAAAPRLLSGGLSGRIAVWDLALLRPASAVDSNGGPVWALAARPGSGKDEPPARRCTSEEHRPALTTPSARLAVRGGGMRRRLRALVWCACSLLGVETSLLISFGADVLSAGDLQLRRALPRVSARVLSCCWHPSRAAVVSGSSDGCVRVWDAATGAELLRLTLPSAGGSPPCVWAVLCLIDGTVVSGDAGGRTCLWDGEHGTLLHAFALHAADVLCLAAAGDGSAVFAAGVDAHVQVITRGAGGAGWAATGSKRAHTHDVRALAVVATDGAGPVLLSSGTDGSVVAYAADGVAGEHAVRVVRAPPPPHTAAAARAPLLLVTHPSCCEVWRLGAAAPPAGAPPRPGALPLASAPACLLRITLRSQRHLLCAAISADGRMVAASDALRARLFVVHAPLLEHPPAAGAGRRRACSRRPLPPSLPAALFLLFTPQWLVLASPAGTVHLVDPGAGACSHVFHPHASAPAGGALPPNPLAIRLPPITAVAASGDGEWLAVSVWAPRGGALATPALSTCVVLFSLDAHAPAATLPLPSDAAEAPPAVCLAFASRGAGHALLALTSAKRALLADLGARPAWDDHSQADALSEVAASAAGHVVGLSLDASKGLRAVLLHTQLSLCHVDLERPLGGAATTALQGSKRRRDRGQHHAPPSGDNNGRVLPLAHPCLLAAYIRPGAVLMVERPWQAVLRALPPPADRKLWRT